MDSDPRRRLPSVDALLEAARANGGAPLLESLGHAGAVEAARAVIADERARLGAGSGAASLEELAARLESAVAQRAAPSLRPVINATGVILQTNLGRAPLSDAAVAAMEQAARGYTNLEFDLDQGERGSRHEHVRELLRRTTGAEDGIVVNNNAAALFMVLQVFAAGREVIVSRGQAVEIGGGFRIPDVLRQSGARLVEVGTTNRTYARDYESAVTDESAAILRVHASNFKVVGFTAAPQLDELATVAHERGLLLLDDLGSGCLVPTEQYGMAHEPMVQESVAGGADLVLFSGDKLLGGPQAGIIVGRAELVEQLRRHPLARALRVDKLTIAALNATLASYARGRPEEVPVWAMLAIPRAELERRARAYVEAARGRGAVVEAMSMVGGGSLPGEGVPSPAARLDVEEPGRLAARLRANDPPVVTRVVEQAVWLDPRTVDNRDDVLVTKALREVFEKG